MEPKQVLDKLIDELGPELILAELPQKRICKLLNLTTMAELAEILGLNYHQLRWRLNAGEIEFPQFKIARRCYYTTEEVKAIKKRWRKKK